MFRLLVVLCGFLAYLSSSENLIDVLNNSLKHVRSVEGHICGKISDQPKFFKDLISSHPFIKKVGEIGFNAGHSSLTFLSAKDDVIVYSFDICEHPYFAIGKKLIDRHFPQRHILIKGNSTKTVPGFHKNHPSLKFDLIFIDGGHSYATASQDIFNMKSLAHKKTLAVLDDYYPNSDVEKAFLGWEKKNFVKKVKTLTSNHKKWVIYQYLF